MGDPQYRDFAHGWISRGGLVYVFLETGAKLYLSRRVLNP